MARHPSGSAAMPRIDLTTVEQSKREMALQAVEILLDKIERGTQHIQATQLRGIRDALGVTYDELLQ